MANSTLESQKSLSETDFFQLDLREWGQRENGWSMWGLFNKEIWAQNIFSQERESQDYLNWLLGLLFRFAIQNHTDYFPLIKCFIFPYFFGFIYKAADRLFPSAAFSCDDSFPPDMEIVIWSDSQAGLHLCPFAYFVFTTLFSTLWDRNIIFQPGIIYLVPNI